MANNVAASMTASIVIDKNDIVVQALQELSKAQKELNNNKLEIFFDISNADIAKKLKEFQKQLSGKDYIIKLQTQGIEEAYKSLNDLIKRFKEIASGKAFGSVNGKGIGNSIVDEKSLNTIIDLFTKIESHLGSMKKVFADVGDGEEFSPLLKTIDKVNTSVSELSNNVKNIGLNMNIDIGSDKEMEAKLQGKISNALQAYQRLFEHIKMSSAGGSAITDKFFEFDISQYDTTMGKLKAYQKFIADMRAEAKSLYNGEDVIYSGTDKKYWSQASAAMGQVTKTFNEMKASSNINPLSDLFGKTDLSEVISQLSLIVTKLGEISTTASEFKSAFANGFNVNASVEEIDKLTNRVKELENELSKVKLNATSATGNKSNISSSSSSALKEEKENIGSVGDSAEETKKKLDDVVFKPNTEGFDEIVSKLDIAKDKIEEISKITKSSVWSESQGEYLESYNIKYKNGTSEIRGESSNKKGSNVLRANEVAYDAKAAEQEAKAVKEVWDKNVKVIQDYMDAVTKLNNLKAQDKGTGTKSSQIALQEKNIEELKEKALDARAAISSMVNPHDVPIDTWRDWLDVMKKFDQASLGSAESVAKLEDALRNASKSNLESMEKSLKSYQDDMSSILAKSEKINTFPEYKTQIDSLNQAIGEYETFVQSLQGKGIIDESDINESDRLKANIEKLLKETKTFSSGDRGYTELGADKVLEKINSILEQNSAMSKKAKAQIKAYYNEILSGNPSRPLNEILDSVYKIVQVEREAGRAGKSWLDIFKDKKLHSVLGQAASMFSFYDLVNVGREGFETIKEYDNALTEMNKVSKESIEVLKDFQKESFDLSDAIGTTASQIQNSTADFLRLGESFEQAKQSAQDANALFKVAEFDNIGEATEALVAMSQAYKEIEKSQINDVLNYTGNNFSISTSELASALQRSAATLKVAGNDIYEATALVTAGNAVLQDAETVGSGKFMPKYIVICRYFYIPESSYIG